MAKRKGSVKSGGRKPGTPNKSSLQAEVLAKKLGIDPLEVLLNIVKADWEALGYDKATETIYMNGVAVDIERIPLKMRMTAADMAVEYIRPKRKAVEHTGKDGGPIETKTDETVVLKTQWREIPKDPNASDA